jgi:hypothetical protein
MHKLFLISGLLIYSTYSFAESVQEVYKYKNKDGVIEYTDHVKSDKKLIGHKEIQKMTPEQEAASKAKLDEIMEKDKALDEKLALERKLERERQLRLQQQSELEAMKNQEAASQKKYYDRNGGDVIVRPPRPFPAKPSKPKPEQPIARPRPRVSSGERR